MKQKRECNIIDCSKPHYGHGWCNAHYKKWRKYGDPLAGRTHALPGEPYKWLLEHVSYTGDDCIKWPYAHTDGYGDVWVDGTHYRAPRLMCELVHGPPPTPKHQTAHNCGKGHTGCINPLHLRWATNKENCADKIKHGTQIRGTNHYAAKLTETDVLRIRELRDKLTAKELAKLFGISINHARKIQRREKWSWLD